MEVLKNDSYSQDDIYRKLLDFSQTRCENNEVIKQENDGVIKNNSSSSNEEEDLLNTTNPVNKTIESDDDDDRTESKNDDDITKRKDADDDLIERKDDDNENDTPDSEDVDDSTKRIYFSTKSKDDDNTKESPAMSPSTNSTQIKKDLKISQNFSISSQETVDTSILTTFTDYSSNMTSTIGPKMTSTTRNQTTTEQSLVIIRKGVNILHKMDDLLSIDYCFSFP